MKIAIFAARATQRKYANQLREYLIRSGDADATVLWYKHLVRNLNWFPALLTSPVRQLIPTVENIINTKRNSPSALASGKKRFPMLYTVKLIEAAVLYAIYSSHLKKQSITHMVIWNGLKFRQRIAVLAARHAGIPCMFIERGLFPGTTTLDPQGINYLNSVPRFKAFYNPTTETHSHQASSTEKPSDLPDSYIFVPFQVNTDSQIVMFSPWLKTMFDLVHRFEQAEQQLGENMPRVIFKTHPACPQDYSELVERINSSSGKLSINTKTPTPTLIQHASAVCTINSSVGMEAILLNRPVLVLGQACYGIEGVAKVVTNQKQLTEALTDIDIVQPSETIRNAFLAHVEQEHIVPGSWHTPDEHHMNKMAERILSFT